MKKWWVMFQELISPVRERKCEWCKEVSRFKRVRIYCEIDPVGYMKSVCPTCVKNTCCGD